MSSDDLTIRIALFDPHTASDELWARFHDTRRALVAELWPRALKAAMLRQVRDSHPEATVIGTNNAEVNAPILSINARVVRVAWSNVDYQVARAALDAWVDLVRR